MAGASGFKWRQAIDGAGFQNAFDVADNAVHSSYPNSAVTGGDVAGFHYTNTRQANCVWSGANRGNVGWNQNNLSGISYSKTKDGYVYAIGGRGGITGTFLISTDAGQSWKASGFDIAGDSRTSGTSAARPSGRMICSDWSGNYVWVAGQHTYGGSKQWGLARSSDLGSTFTPGFAMGSGLIPNGTKIRFVVQHPSDDTVIFCGADGGTTPSNGGLYRIESAKGVPNVTKIAGPGGTSSLTSANWFRDAFCIMEGSTPMMYFVAGAVSGSTVSGMAVYRYNLSPGGMIANLSAGDLDGTSQWTAIDGYRKGANTVIWTGCWQPKASSGGKYAAVVVSRDSGSTWDKQASANAVDTMPSGRKWWLLPYMEKYRYNTQQYDCAALRVDPNNTNIVYSAGRAGIWRTVDDGATWKPVMEQLAVSMDEGSVYNPVNKSQIMAGNVDWNAVVSNDKFTYGTLPVMKFPSASGGESALSSHWSSAGITIGFGGRSDNASKGAIATSTNIFASGVSSGFNDQGWMASRAAANRLRPTAVIDGVSAAGNRVILAVAQFSQNDGGSAGDSGIWRKEITTAPAVGSWVQVETLAFTQRTVQNTQRSKFFWPNSSTNPVVYTYDRKQGKLWRSKDRGLNWTVIWSPPAGEVSGTPWSGHMAGATSSLVYVSTDKNVYRIENADNSPNAVTLNRPSGLTAPGPIAIDDDGWLYVTQRNGNSAIKTGLWRYDMAATSNVAADWDNLTTNEFLGKVAFPQSFDVITEGAKKTLLIDCWGNGLYIGEATDTPPARDKFAENFENNGAPVAAGTVISSSNSSFTAVTGSPTFTSTSQEGTRAGLFSVGISPGACTADSMMLTASSKYAVDFYFNAQSLPSSTTRIVALRDGAGTAYTGIQLSPTGNLILQDGMTAVYTTSTQLDAGSWCRIAVKWDADANANSMFLKLWVGDNLLATTPDEQSGSKSYTNNTNTEQVRIGILSSTVANTSLIFDDIMTKDEGSWPDRGAFDPSHVMTLGHMPMGIKPSAGPDPLPPGGYITIMFGRSGYQALVGGSPIPGKTKTIMDAAAELKARGLFGVGGVVMDRTQQSVREVVSGFYTSVSWDDMANLRDNFGWHFVSQSKTYPKKHVDADDPPDITTMTNHEKYVESGQTLITLESKGHMNGWGCFNYPNNLQDASAQAVVNQYFAGGRKYSTISQQNTKASLNSSTHTIYTYSTKGGRCNTVGAACSTLPVDRNYVHDSPASLAEYMSPPPGVWRVIQFYRFVDGANGTLAAGTSNWDCTSNDWKQRWTGQPELFPWKSFLEALDARTTDAKCVHPAEMAALWGRIPPRPHGTPGI